MTSTQNRPTAHSWSRAILNPVKEFPLTQLEIVSGNIPIGLAGTLYRNGPGCLQRDSIRVGHWFDGDGAILAVNFENGTATATYRFVQTAAYQREEAANRYLFANYGMSGPGNWWQRLFTPVKNAANTAVLALPDKLLALWEGGKPHALDLQSLQTWGEDDLGALQKGWSYSAHYKQDGKTGDIFNFGMTPGLNGTLRIYRSNSRGKMIKLATHSLDGVPLIHDFVMAGEYLIFFIPPVRLNLWATVFAGKSFSEALSWLPQKSTQILVFDRNNLQLISQSFTDSWFQWHFSNGYVDGDGRVIIDFAQYQDFQTNQYLQEVSTGTTQTLAKSCLARVYLHPQTAKVIKVERILDRDCEFPSVPRTNVGKYSRYIYLSTYRPHSNPQTEILNAIARFDSETGKIAIADVGENCYPCEPIFVSNGAASDEGWVLTVVYDGNHHSSQVWVYDSDRLDDEPICKLQLPSFIAHGFHGTWHSCNELI